MLFLALLKNECAGKKKKIPVGFREEYLHLWWMSCAVVRGTHLPWTCGGTL